MECVVFCKVSGLLEVTLILNHYFCRKYVRWKL